MKNKAIIISLCLLFAQSSFAKLGFPLNEWHLEGPGGLYGVVSCDTEWSIVELGPFSFTSSSGFENTRFMYFGMLPILLIGFVIAVILFFMRRINAEVPQPSFKDIFKRNFDYCILISIVMLGYFIPYFYRIFLIILLLAVGIAIFLFYRKRKNLNEQTFAFKNIIMRNNDYCILILVVVISISFCAMLPKYLDWKQRNIDKKLLHAIINNNNGLVEKYLSDKNINSFLCTNAGYPPPLLLAAKEGNLVLVKYFLKKGAYLEFHDDNGTALHYACSSCEDSIDIVKYLIEKGANVNAVNFWSKTPLDVAATTDIEKYLIKHGAKTGKEIKN